MTKAELEVAQREMREKWAELRNQIGRRSRRDHRLNPTPWNLPSDGPRRAYKEELLAAAEFLEFAWLAMHGTQFEGMLETIVLGAVRTLRISADRADRMEEVEP